MPENTVEMTEEEYDSLLFGFHQFFHKAIITEAPEIKAKECASITTCLIMSITGKGNRDKLIRLMDGALIYGKHNQEDEDKEAR